jgi:hypothetical protein
MFLQFVTVDDVRILRDIGKFYYLFSSVLVCGPTILYRTILQHTNCRFPPHSPRTRF